MPATNCVQFLGVSGGFRYGRYVGEWNIVFRCSSVIFLHVVNWTEQAMSWREQAMKLDRTGNELDRTGNELR